MRPFGVRIVKATRPSVAVEWRRLKPRDPLVLNLPFPPSANNLLVDISGRGRIPTEHYEKWRICALKAIAQSRLRRIPASVEISILFKDGPGRRDIGHLAKVCVAILVEKGIIEDDNSKILRKLTLGWGDVSGAAIEIRPVAL